MFEDIGNRASVKETIAQAQRITKFIYNHQRLLAEFRKAVGGDLARPGITRFATNYLALHSMQEKKDAIIKFFSGDVFLNGPWRKSSEGKEVYGIIHNMRFWEKMSGTLQLLTPLYAVLRLVDGERRATLPWLYDAMQKALEKIHETQVPGRETVHKIVSKRWEDMLNSDLIQAAHYLNPKVIFEWDQHMNLDLQAAVRRVIQKLVPDIREACDAMEEIKYYRESSGSFSSPYAMMARGRTAPAEWWMNYGDSAPALKKVAMKVTSQTCSSSGCERNWSTFSLIQTKCRNRLQHQKLQDLVYLHYNMRLKARNMEREQLRKDVQYDPTDVYNAEDAVVQDWVECVNLDEPALDEGQPPEPAKFVCDEIGSPAVREWREEEAKRRKTTAGGVGTTTGSDVIGDSPKRKSRLTASQKGKSSAGPVRDIDEELVGSDDETEEENPKDVGYKTHDDDDEDDASSPSTPSSDSWARELRKRMGSALDTIPPSPDYGDRGRQVTADDRKFGSQSERKTYTRRPKGPGGSQAAAGADFASGIFGDPSPYYMEPPSYPYAEPPSYSYAEPPSYPYQDPQNYSYGYGYTGESTAQPVQPPSYPYDYSSQSYHPEIDQVSDNLSRVNLRSSHTSDDIERPVQNVSKDHDEAMRKAMLLQQWSDYFCHHMSWEQFQDQTWNNYQIWLDFQPLEQPRSSFWY